MEPCKYAGDIEDEYCSNCDGITIVADELGGSEVCATECGGYEVVEPETAVIVEPEVSPPTEVVSDREITVESPESTSTNTNVPRGIITTIKAESGVSVELRSRSGNTQWYKFSYSETRTVPEDCNIEEEKKYLWNDVHFTVDTQVQDTIKELQK